MILSKKIKIVNITLSNKNQRKENLGSNDSCQFRYVMYNEKFCFQSRNIIHTYKTKAQFTVYTC